jgi:queuosine precursor transporter
MRRASMFLDKRHKLFLVLTAVFVTCFVVGDIIGGKLIGGGKVFGFETLTTVGMLPFPVTFLLTDLLNEFYGKRAARFVTLVGFAMGAMSFAIIYVAAKIPIAELARTPGWDGVTEASFNNVFLGSLRMIIASLSAYLIAQFVDIGVFHLLKGATSGKLLWLRATGSTAVSQLIDTIVINVIAFSSGKTASHVINIIFTAYGLKLAIAVGLTPVIYVMHTLVQRGLGIQPILIGDAPDDAVPSPAPR